MSTGSRNLLARFESSDGAGQAPVLGETEWDDWGPTGMQTPPRPTQPAQHTETSPLETQQPSVHVEGTLVMHVEETVAMLAHVVESQVMHVDSVIRNSAIIDDVNTQLSTHVQELLERNATPTPLSTPFPELLALGTRECVH